MVRIWFYFNRRIWCVEVLKSKFWGQLANVPKHRREFSENTREFPVVAKKKNISWKKPKKTVVEEFAFPLSFLFGLHRDSRALYRCLQKNSSRHIAMMTRAHPHIAHNTHTRTPLHISIDKREMFKSRNFNHVIASHSTVMLNLLLKAILCLKYHVLLIEFCDWHSTHAYTHRKIYINTSECLG